ncbi:MAG TPA: DUF5777 family beta-barrel protein [Chitinophagaceae bacterium]|nr:DUF5777 family beta-barrel protein [Chitinophagaceae bacterium]HNU12809.1 DUF5777 family beta-barrel protein [Chitinophagaceae bacterium]
MKQLFTLVTIFISLLTTAQDSIIGKKERKPVRIFSATKTINARTTEVTGKGKMDFNVTHNFGDMAGDNGGIKRFFGLDNAADIRIGFHIGLGHKTDFVFARAKGAGLVQNLWEFGIKHQLLQQRQDDPTHPLSVAVYANAVISSQTRNAFDNQDNSFENLGDRTSNVIQIILAKKVGKVSVQLNPTYMTRGYAISYDQQSMFAMGGAIRLPLVSNKLNLVVDYFHPFRNQDSKDSFAVNDNIKFYDPLGVGFEILTSGHIFRLNFTNATEILENRFIPRTITSWGKGQFRWGFTISRAFTLWREKR